MVCQDDGSALTFQRTGVMVCGLCRGRLLNRAALETILPDWKKRLVPDAAAKRPARTCPRCHQGMSIRHIERLPISFDWCASCECVWLEQPDEQLLRQIQQRAAPALLGSPTQPLDSNSDRSALLDWLEAFFESAPGDGSVWDLFDLFDDD